MEVHLLTIPIKDFELINSELIKKTVRQEEGVEFSFKCIDSAIMMLSLAGLFPLKDKPKTQDTSIAQPGMFINLKVCPLDIEFTSSIIRFHFSRTLPVKKFSLCHQTLIF